MKLIPLTQGRFAMIDDEDFDFLNQWKWHAIPQMGRYGCYAARTEFEQVGGPEETGKMKMAKEGRLTLKNMRLEAEKIVKAKRDEVKYAMANFVLEDKLWLKAGQMMEATFKNLEIKLEEKEKFAERWKAEEKEKLKAERTLKLQPYLEFITLEFIDLVNMGDADFEKLLATAKLSLQAKIEMEKKAEEERIAKEIAEKLLRERQIELAPYQQFNNLAGLLITTMESEFKNILSNAVTRKSEYEKEQEKIHLENERLKAEALAREKQLAEERAKDEAERKAVAMEAEAKLKAEREANEKIQAAIKTKAEAERKAAETQAAKARAEAAAKLKAEREANEKLQAELKAKQEAEDKAKADAEALIEAEAAKGDKEKFADFINELKGLTTKYSFKSKKHKGNYHHTCEKINQLINQFNN